MTVYYAHNFHPTKLTIVEPRPAKVPDIWLVQGSRPFAIGCLAAYNPSMNKAAEKYDMKAAGIDLAEVESRPTGLCLMDGTLHASACLLYTDDGITRNTIECRPDVVAIDAPLALPRGRESLSKRSDVHLRGCDRELLRMGIKFFPLTLGPMRLLTGWGMRLRADLERKGVTVIETYPGAAQDILRIPRKGKGLDRLTEGLHVGQRRAGHERRRGYDAGCLLAIQS